jgi:hypothetical protein
MSMLMFACSRRAVIGDEGQFYRGSALMPAPWMLS